MRPGCGERRKVPPATISGVTQRGSRSTIPICITQVEKVELGWVLTIELAHIFLHLCHPRSSAAPSVPLLLIGRRGGGDNLIWR